MRFKASFTLLLSPRGRKRSSPLLLLFVANVIITFVAAGSNYHQKDQQRQRQQQQQCHGRTAPNKSSSIVTSFLSSSRKQNISIRADTATVSTTSSNSPTIRKTTKNVTSDTTNDERNGPNDETSFRRITRRRGHQKVKRITAKMKKIGQKTGDKVVAFSKLSFIGDYDDSIKNSKDVNFDQDDDDDGDDGDDDDDGNDYERNRKWVSSLLSDIRDRFNTDEYRHEVTDRVRCEKYSTTTCIVLTCMNIRGGGGIGSSRCERSIIRGRKKRGNTSGIRSRSLWRNNMGSQVKKERDEKDSIFDDIGKSLSLYAAVIVLIQTVHSLLIHDDNVLLNEIASKLLSTESAVAVKTIREIIKNFPEHGVVDVFSEYPTKDVVMSILALSRLQRAVYNITPTTTITQSDREREGESRNGGNNVVCSTISGGDDDVLKNEYELLADLAHYSVFAHAAYGWKMGLLSGRLHIGDLATLLRKTGIQKHHVIETNWKSKTHLPAYFLVRDVEKKKIVLCIRGTLSAKDILTDLCCTAEDFLSHEEEEREAESFRTKLGLNYRARAHQGMVSSARSVSKMTHQLIASELESNPDYHLVLVGHSLGGGVAAVLGTLWRDTFPGLNVYAYGCPCVGPIGTYPTNLNESIISVVGDGDPFSSLSLGHLADISAALSKLCEDDELRSEIFNRTKTKNIDEMSDDDLSWCATTLQSLQSFDTTTEKFYPPGRVLHMRGNLFGLNVDEVTLTEVRPEEAFRDLKLHPRMFDLSLHIPQRYEVLLSRIWSNVNKKKVK